MGLGIVYRVQSSRMQTCGQRQDCTGVCVCVCVQINLRLNNAMGESCKAASLVKIEPHDILQCRNEPSAGAQQMCELLFSTTAWHTGLPKRCRQVEAESPLRHHQPCHLATGVLDGFGQCYTTSSFRLRPCHRAARATTRRGALLNSLVELGLVA